MDAFDILHTLGVSNISPAWICEETVINMGIAVRVSQYVGIRSN